MIVFGFLFHSCDDSDEFVHEFIIFYGVCYYEEHKLELNSWENIKQEHYWEQFPMARTDYIRAREKLKSIISNCVTWIYKQRLLLHPFNSKNGVCNGICTNKIMSSLNFIT